MAIQTTGIIVRVNDTDIGALQALGDIKIARGTKEYSALNTQDVIIAVGRAQVGDLSVKVLLNPDDTGAQKALHDAVLNAGTVKFEVELPNKVTDSGNGTKYTWEGAVVTDETITPDEDGFLLASFILKTPGFPVITAAA